MKVLLLLLVLLLFTTLQLKAIFCIDNTQSVAETQKEKTNKKLDEKEKEIEKVIEKYEAALKSKREMMLKLDQNITRIEYVMKENQALRKKILMYWEDVKKTNSRVSSF